MTKPSEVGHINWDPNLRFDPTNAGDPFATHGIPAPTYGNYGGPGYTAGTIGGTASVPADPLPVDALDQIFYQHDLALQTDFGNPAAIVADSITAVIQMDILAHDPNGIIDPNSPHYDPAAQLYEGLAAIGVIGQLIAPAWDLIGQQPGGQFIQQQIVSAAQNAIANFEEGLAAIPGEAGSLHGAFHVFEQKFADMLPFDLL